VRTVVRILLCVAVAGSAAVGAQEAPSDSNAEYSDRGADTCLACHDDDESLGLFRTDHAVPSDSRSPFGRGQLQCEACHGPGDAHSARVRRGEERPPILAAGFAQNALCLDCHDSDVGSGWHGDTHAFEEIGCSDCHSSHTPHDAVAETVTQAEVCYDCHPLQRSEALRAFSHPLFDGKMSCTGCHSPHDSAADFQLARSTLNDTCYQCHAEKRGPFLWEHAPVAEDCSLCHAAHGSNHPGILSQRAPLLCQGCHSTLGHPSVLRDAGGIATAIPSQFLLGQGCMNCHEQVHGSNHPSGSTLMR